MPQKFLCICQYGHSRSVACARVLHGLGQVAVAIGRGTSGDAVEVLGEWSDKILVMQEIYRSHVPQRLQHKVVAIDVGQDVWVNPYNLELQDLIKRLLKEQLGLG